MHRIDADGHVGNTFFDGDPSIPTRATQVDDDWLNAVQEEMANSIEGAGVTLVKGTNTQLLQVLALMVQGAEPGGRLTLTTAVPVTTSDVSAAGTVYYTPHRNNRIVLYDGSKWVWYTFSELSQATTDNTKSPAACANNSNYDVFAWNDSGTRRATRGPAWSSDTARGTGAGTTELELFEGRWVNKVAITNGPAARRGLYLGTVRTDGSAVVNDTLAKRHVWNMYNRVERAMQVLEGTASWVYDAVAYQQANASAANQLDYVQGLLEEPVYAEVFGHGRHTNISSALRVGIGVDSASTDSSTTQRVVVTQVNNSDILPVGAVYCGFPGLGRHYLAWLESSAGAATTTWEGSGRKSGILGRVFA